MDVRANTGFAMGCWVMQFSVKARHLWSVLTVVSGGDGRWKNDGNQGCWVFFVAVMVVSSKGRADGDGVNWWWFMLGYKGGQCRDARRWLMAIKMVWLGESYVLGNKHAVEMMVV
ncbi:unnamed protein product [Lactuca virosa]|uniref:Uncharacterized protein n=1 Tax=Lactuca virosa TaxID=75947 RepID=A0AAU9M8X3_9ASTR|nr:unnamed protein product [Lactuca virosa]